MIISHFRKIANNDNMYGGENMKDQLEEEQTKESGKSAVSGTTQSDNTTISPSGQDTVITTSPLGQDAVATTNPSEQDTVTTTSSSGQDTVTIGGKTIENIYKYEGKNYISLRHMIYALEGITHEENQAMVPNVQKVIWNNADKIAIFRIIDRFIGLEKLIQFSTEGLQKDTKPTPREITINGEPTGKIDFVYRNDLNMIGFRELAKLAGLETYLQWYKKDGGICADLRLEDPHYGRDSLKAAVDAIVKDQGGIPEKLNGEFYQVLYGTADQGGKVNRYSGYTFCATDAIQWLIQTGGNLSIALQIRDTVKLTDCERQIQAAINGQWAIIQQFLQAKDMLEQCGYKKVKMPYFYIGTPEENVKITYYGTEGMIAIYNGIVDKLDKAGYQGDKIKEMIGGMYFGSETAKGDIDSKFDFNKIKISMKKQEGKFLWIPYFTTREELETIRKTAAYFDKVILQPTTFYVMDKYYLRKEKDVGYVGNLGDGEKWNDILNFINQAEAENKEKDKFGIELEFDMGLLTGRGDREPPMTPGCKSKAFKTYIDKIIPYIGKIPIGIYSGGPNEQGYNNIVQNNNLHNNENHLPYEPVVEGFGTGSSYSDLYKGNLIYNINKILFANKINLCKQNELNKVLASL